MNCTATDVESRTDLSAQKPITIVGGIVYYQPKVLHAGIITHVCKLPADHFPTLCECECGHKWLRNFK